MLDISPTLRDFRLPPWSRWVRCSGLLRSEV